MFKVQIISSNSEFSSVLAEWEDFLSHRAEKCSFWQDPHEIYFLVNGGDWNAMKVVLLRQDDKIVCVAPCVIRRQSFNFQFGVLRIPGPRVRILKILDSDFVFSKGVDKSFCVQKVLEVLRDIRTEFDVIYMENIIASNPTWKVFEGNTCVAGFKLQRITQKMQVIRRQVLLPSYDEWLKSLKGKTRYNLKRRTRILFKRYPEQVECKRVSSAHEVKEFLDMLDELFPKTWQAKTFAIRKRNKPEDVERLMHIAKKGWLRSYILLINQTPVAFILGYQYGGVFEHAECGYDPEYAREGVGSVLSFLMIKDLYQWNKPKILSFGFGENDYKRILGGEERNAFAAYLLLPGRCRFLVKFQIFFIIIGERVKSLCERFGADQYLRKIWKSKK